MSKWNIYGKKNPETLYYYRTGVIGSVVKLNRALFTAADMG